jgi:hypothetical protein
MKNFLFAKQISATRLGVTVGVWFVVYFVVRGLLEDPSLAISTRIMIALVPVPFFVLLVITFIQGIRGMDELQKRIQLEALAIAFPVAVFLLTTLGLVQHAVELSLMDWSYTHVGFMVVAIYFLSIGFVSGRYR